MTDRRASDKGLSRIGLLLRENWYRDLWLLIISGFLVWSILAFQAESTDRRDQTCTLFEKAQRDAVSQLRQTYDYLVSLTPKERHEGFNPAILANLPNVERIARTTGAPEYCNEPGVGLPEPDPVVPVRPPGLVP